jgi:phosphoglycerate dehydrogenase-like enzyme
MIYNALITDYIKKPYSIEKASLGDQWRVFDEDDIREGKVSESEIVAVFVWHANVDDNFIARFQNCKLVIRYGVGYDNVNLIALENRGVVFCNNPDYGTDEVADTALAMILSGVRRIFPYSSIAQHLPRNWQENTIKGISRSQEQVIGIVGIGRIGTAVALRLKAFKFRIIFYDPYVPSGYEKALGIERVEQLDDLLPLSDVVTLHCPLTGETSRLFNNNFFSKLKKNSGIVNTARGELISDLDLALRWLEENPLSFLYLDVLPEEPPPERSTIGNLLSNFESFGGRLLINPHTAYFSDDSWLEMRRNVAITARNFFQNGTIRNRISSKL